MQPYFFTIKATPVPGNPQCDGKGGAYFYIWVFDDDDDSAYDKAIRYVYEYGWRPASVEAAYLAGPERIARLDAQTAKSYRHAELYGIGCHVESWPEKPQPGVYSVEPLEKPPKGKGLLVSIFY